MRKVEYRVRPVVRYIVTRYESWLNENSASCAKSEVIGEFEQEGIAEHVGNSLAHMAAELEGIPDVTGPAGRITPRQPPVRDDAPHGPIEGADIAHHRAAEFGRRAQ